MSPMPYNRSGVRGQPTESPPPSVGRVGRAGHGP